MGASSEEDYGDQSGGDSDGSDYDNAGSGSEGGSEYGAFSRMSIFPSTRSATGVKSLAASVSLTAALRL